MGLGKLYKRWRHTRGFGVHSPYGYDVVKSVVAPSRIYGWYGYAAIDVALAQLGGLKWRRVRQKARLALRLTWRLNPARVLVSEKLEEAVMRGVESVVGASDIVVTSDGASATIRGVSVNPEALYIGVGKVQPWHLRWIETGGALLLMDMPIEEAKRGAEEIASVMPHGLILEGRRRLIAIPKAAMSLSRYTIL